MKKNSFKFTTSLCASLCLAMLACSDDDESPKQHILKSGTNQLTIDVSAKTISLDRSGTRLLRLSASDLEVGVVDRADDMSSYDPYWFTEAAGVLRVDPPRDLRFRAIESWSLNSASEQAIVLDVQLAQSLLGTLTLSTTKDGFVSDFEVSSTGPDIVLYRLATYSNDKEGFYGLGEWPDGVNHRGRSRPMQLEADLIIESASNENHAPIPFLIGTTGWGLFIESKRVGLFDVAIEQADKTQVTFAGESLRFHFFGADHPLDITKHYYGVTGQPKLPAPWALGPFIWRDENKDQAQVEEDIELIRDLDLATTAIWIDRPYASAVNTFDFKPEDYPNPQAMIDKAHAFGLRVGLWHTPYLAADAQPLLSEAEANGYFPKVTGTLLNKWGVPLDLTNPEAYDWWQTQLKKYTDMGIEGFKLDYAEDIVAGISGGRNIWVFKDGSDERTMHYGYTNLYHQIYAEMLPADGGFLLCRAARWGDQVNGPIIWPGDLDANFAKFGEKKMDRNGESYTAVGGIPSSISMNLGLGPSGFPFYGADTGGYRHSPPDRETFIRWFQQTALSVVMQVGDSSSQTPWEFNEENGRDQATLDSYREFARLHLRLFPYLWTYAQRVLEDGRAIQRPLGLAYPELGEHPYDTFMLGDHLLVAPVIERGAVTRDLTFPAGEWLHWFKDEKRNGGAATVDAPLFELPLYLAAGAIIPMLRPTIDTFSPTDHPDRVDSFATDVGQLYVRIFPGEATEFTLYDATTIGQEKQGKNTTVSLQAGTTYTKGFVVELLDIKEDPSMVTVDGNAVMDWTRTSSAPHILSVSVPAGGQNLSVSLP